MGLKQERVNAGKECCKLANQRFGLEVLCEALLSDLNCCDNTRKKIIKLAKNRDFKGCSKLIEDIKSTKAHFVTINHITSAMRPKNETT